MSILQTLACLTFIVICQVIIQRLPKANSKIKNRPEEVADHRITAVIACMAGKRDCNALAVKLNDTQPRVVNVLVYEIHSVDGGSEFKIRGTDGQKGVMEPETGVSRKVRQFRHFMQILALVRQSALACRRKEDLVLLLDDDVSPCVDAMSWMLQTLPSFSLSFFLFFIIIFLYAVFV